MQWQDEAFIISVRKYGETGLLAHIFASEHGHCAGFLRRGAGSRGRKAGLWQPGQKIQASWKARLATHLGHFSFEAIEAGCLADIIDKPERLFGLQSFCHLIETALPEGLAYERLYEQSQAFLAGLNNEDWLENYIRWELAFLAATGYGLNLSCCAITGNKAGLKWVSPKTGKAVSEEAGQEWAKRLLPLPSFLVGEGACKIGQSKTGAEWQDGLNLTGFFLERELLTPIGKALPASRQRLLG